MPRLARGIFFLDTKPIANQQNLQTTRSPFDTKLATVK